MNLKWPVVLVSLIALPLAARGEDPLSARERLDTMNVSFSTESFIEQVRRGEADVVNLFLQAGMSSNAMDQSGRPALIWAAGNGQTAVVERLLQSGADLCGTGRGGASQSALVWAASNGRTEAARALLKAGARACEKDKTRQTAVLSAAVNGYAETLKMLLDRIDDVTWEEKTGAYALAAEYGHLDVVRLLLEAGVEVSARPPRGSTALAGAALRGRAEVVKFLLDRGADPNEPVDLSGTVLGAAAAGGHLPVVNLLLERGARADGAALREAAGAGQAEIVARLLDAGVGVNTIDAYKTPLIAATIGRRVPVVQLLIARGADLNARTLFSDPPLLLASQAGAEEIVTLLLKGGADLGVRGKEGRTALMEAAVAGHPGTAKILIEGGADVRATDEMGKTALVYARERGQGEVAQLLMKAEAAPPAPSNEPFSPQKVKDRIN